MSSTRRALNSTELHQNRWSSSSEFTHSINALLAAKRIREVDDPEMQKLLWFIQYRSLEPRGLKLLAAELIKEFSERQGTLTLRTIGLQPRRRYNREQVEAILKDAATRLPEHLARICLNPEIELTSARPSTDFEKTAGVWYVDDLLGALKILRQRFIDRARRQLAETEITALIIDTLEFWQSEPKACMVLVTGKPGVGKTVTLQAVCDMSAGMVRYIETPASNSNRDFYAAVARALGCADGSSYNGSQIKAKVEETLHLSELSLAYDEAQMLWPQHARPQSRPERLQWIKTMLDSGTAVALVGLPEFRDWQELYVKKSLWRDEQLDRRLNRTIELGSHTRMDLIRIARVLHPDGDEPMWDLLAGYALGSKKKRASAIAEALRSARYVARKDSRDVITYEDIEAAVELDFAPLSDQLFTDVCNESVHAVKSRCKDNAGRF
jgi:AAA domain-containing protein